MRQFDDFKSALECFRLYGGAMNEDQGLFFVGSYDEINDVVDDPRQSTEQALHMGGMSEQEIKDELIYWQ